MASDNDGDQSFIFPDLSKHPTADAIPLAEAMQPYQQLVDADQKDVTATKPKFADLQAIHGTDFHRQ